MYCTSSFAAADDDVAAVAPGAGAAVSPDVTAAVDVALKFMGDQIHRKEMMDASNANHLQSTSFFLISSLASLVMYFRVLQCDSWSWAPRISVVHWANNFWSLSTNTSVSIAHFACTAVQQSYCEQKSIIYRVRLHYLHQSSLKKCLYLQLYP